MADTKASLDPEDYEDIEIDDPENPEWTEEDFAKARPFKDVFPEMYAKWEADRAAGVKPTVGHIRTFELSLPLELFEAYAARQPLWAEKMERMLEASIRAELAEPSARKRA